MSFPQNSLGKICRLAIFIILTATIAAAQQGRGALRGLITDELGAAIVGANVTLTDANGVEKKTTTNGEGVYNFAGLTPGKYKLQANAPGFAHSASKEVDVTNARQTRSPILPSVPKRPTTRIRPSSVAKIWTRCLTIRTSSQPRSRRSLVHQSVQTADRSSSTVSLGAICPRKMRFARFVSTKILSRRRTINPPRVSIS